MSRRRIVLRTEEGLCKLRGPQELQEGDVCSILKSYHENWNPLFPDGHYIKNYEGRSVFEWDQDKDFIMKAYNYVPGGY